MALEKQMYSKADWCWCYLSDLTWEAVPGFGIACSGCQLWEMRTCSEQHSPSLGSDEWQQSSRRPWCALCHCWGCQQALVAANGSGPNLTLSLVLVLCWSIISCYPGPECRDVFLQGQVCSSSVPLPLPLITLVNFVIP